MSNLWKVVEFDSSWEKSCRADSFWCERVMDSQQKLSTRQLMGKMKLSARQLLVKVCYVSEYWFKLTSEIEKEKIMRRNGQVVQKHFFRIVIY
jgi:hypothetical protein